MHRFAAKLLFQYRVDVDGDPGKRRLCEERIINFAARSSREALRMAKIRGKKGEHSYKNSDGNTVSFEFIGIMDLMSLGVEAEADEVWYDIGERLLPMERRDKIIPADNVLLSRLGKGAGYTRFVLCKGPRDLFQAFEHPRMGAAEVEADVLWPAEEGAVG